MISVQELTQEIIQIQQNIDAERDAQERVKNRAENYGGVIGTVSALIFFLGGFVTLVVVNPHSSLVFGGIILLLTILAVFVMALLAMTIQNSYYKKKGFPHEKELSLRKEELKRTLYTYAQNNYGITLDGRVPNEIDQVVLLEFEGSIREVKFVNHNGRIALLSQGVELKRM
jgi:ABC-type multidrug transport system fused ATPase/permease subunit